MRRKFAQSTIRRLLAGAIVAALLVFVFVLLARDWESTAPARTAVLPALVDTQDP